MQQRVVELGGYQVWDLDKQKFVRGTLHDSGVSSAEDEGLGCLWMSKGVGFVDLSCLWVKVRLLKLANFDNLHPRSMS